MHGKTLAMQTQHARPRRFFAQFWASWVPNAKSFAAQVLLFLPMVFRSILPKDGIKQQKFWPKWGTKQALNTMR